MKTVYQTIALIILCLLISCADSFAGDKTPRKRELNSQTYTYTCSSGNTFKIITSNPAALKILHTVYADWILRERTRKGMTSVYFRLKHRQDVECYMKHL